MSLAALVSLVLCVAPVQEDEIRLPFGVPPASENPAMAQAAPEECLFYLRWAPSASLADQSASSSTERLIADPEFRLFVDSLIRQLDQFVDANPSGDPNVDRAARKLVAMLPGMISNGGAMYIERFDPMEEQFVGALIMELKDSEEETSELIKGFVSDVIPDIVIAERWGNGDLYRIPQGSAPITLEFAVRDGLLILAAGDGTASAALASMDTPAPGWLVETEELLPIERRSLVMRLQLDRVVDLLQATGDDELSMIVDVLSLDKLQSLVATAGLDGDKFTSKSMLDFGDEVPPIFAALSGEPLSTDDFKLVPADAVMALILKQDWERIATTVIESVVTANPDEEEEIRQAYVGAGEPISPQLFLKSLGDTKALYYSPKVGGDLFGFGLTVAVDDAETLTKMQTTIVERLREVWKVDEGARDDFFSRDSMYRLGESDHNGRTIYFVAPESIWDFTPIAFSWCLADDRLVFGPSPQAVRTIIDLDADTETLLSNELVAQALEADHAPHGLIYMEPDEIVQSFTPYMHLLMLWTQEMDGRFGEESLSFSWADLPSSYALAQHWTPDVGTMRVEGGKLIIESHETVPGVQAATAIALVSAGAMALEVNDVTIMSIFSPAYAHEQESIINLKMMGLAMHNFHDVYTRLPASAGKDDEGNELLSWRVQILPFVDEQDLYDQFHHNEPWDSEHNIKLVEKMPDVFKAPGSELEPGKTVYLTVRTESSIFPGEKGIRFADITDGLSNTIMVVEANESAAVTWTKPDDLQADPMKPTKQLVGLRKGGFLVVLGDGAVYKLPDSLDAAEINRWIGRNDGEINEYNPYDYR